VLPVISSSPYHPGLLRHLPPSCGALPYPAHRAPSSFYEKNMPPLLSTPWPPPFPPAHYAPAPRVPSFFLSYPCFDLISVLASGEEIPLTVGPPIRPLRCYDLDIHRSLDIRSRQWIFARHFTVIRAPVFRLSKPAAASSVGTGLEGRLVIFIHQALLTSRRPTTTARRELLSATAIVLHTSLPVLPAVRTYPAGGGALGWRSIGFPPRRGSGSTEEEGIA